MSKMFECSWKMADPTVERLVIGAIVGFEEHSLEMVKLLEQYGADLHTVYTNELTGQPMNALGEAVGWDKEDVAEYLRSKGCVMPPTAPAVKVVSSLEDEVVLHFAENFGPVLPQSVFEIVPTEPRITVRIIPPSDNRNHVTLFTTGLSNHAMVVPKGLEEFQYAELFVHSRPTGIIRIFTIRCTVGRSNGCARWLSTYRNNTWLPAPVTIFANGDPPQPLGPNVPFTALLLLTEKQFTAAMAGRFNCTA